jgi:hypothetical protein
MTAGASVRIRFWIAVAILCSTPLYFGVQGTRHLDWPDDPDLFRESALAQSFADGHLLQDPYYLGEWIWYPPLVPALVAGLSRVTGAPVPTVYARAGAYLDLLGPILFAVLVARCFGSLAGLVALTVFLFRIPRGPTGVSPLYSTLLYSGNFALGLFFLTLLPYVSLPEGRRLRYALTGLFLGLTLLGHAGPFVVLAGLFALELARAAVREPRAALARYALLGATAALAAMPLLVSIVGHYHLRILNPAPTQWIAWSATATAMGRQVDRYAWMAGLALVVLWARGPRERAWVVSAWVVSAAGLVGYSFVAPALGWRTVVPRHHLVVYLWAVQPLLIGYGASVLWSIAEEWMDRSPLLARPRRAAARERTRWIVVVGGALAVVLAALPGQMRRAGPLGTGIIPYSTVEASLDAYRWMRSALRPDDVVLATDDRALMVVGPAGAKVVALEALFANLYVDNARRTVARDEMFAALRRGDEAAFETLADEYSVTGVLWVAADGPWFDATPFRRLALAFDNRKVRIYRRTGTRARSPSDATRGP